MDYMPDKQHLQDIGAYVFEEKKIVTYKWLSTVLGLHVNTAKQLLHSFFEDVEEKQKSQLQVTYLIGGILNNDQGYRFQAVKKENVDKLKCHFKTVTSEHIYSLCVANELYELGKLSAIDNLVEEDATKNAAVRCDKCVVREAELDAIKRQETLVKPDESKHWTTNNTKVEKSAQSSTKVDGSKEKGKISAMFSAQVKPKTFDSTDSKVKEEQPETLQVTQPTAKKPSKVNKTSGGRLAAMFSAQSAKPKPKKGVDDKPAEDNPKEVMSTENEEDMKTTPKNEASAVSVSEERKDIKSASRKSTLTNRKSKNEGTRKSKQKKRTVSGSSESTAKKRKRILVADSDSSDDDIFGREDSPTRSPSPAPPTPEEDEKMEISETSPRAEVATNGRKHIRKRRLVDHTFMDEQGFIVTKKEYVLESCSESEKEDEKENMKGSNLKVNEERSPEKKESEQEVEEGNVTEKQDKAKGCKSNEKTQKKKGKVSSASKEREEVEEGNASDKQGKAKEGKSNEKTQKKKGKVSNASKERGQMEVEERNASDKQGKAEEAKSNEKPQKKKGKVSNSSKKKSSPPGSTKQAMLTSFFKKC